MSLPRLAPPFGPRLFTAKTRVPLPPPHFLSRPRLLESLRARISVHKLVVVLAPSGFGKTTMVAELARTLAGEAAWLTLDSSDQDLSVFVHYLIAAVAHGRPGFGADLLAWLAATPTPGDQIEDCAAILVDALEQLEATPLVLFLDDFQEVSGNASITRLLDRVLRYLPPPIHLVLSARREPALTTTRLLAEQQISGLGADDLRFTVSETEHWLALRADPATPTAVQQLVTTTEGWITGMILQAAAPLPLRTGLPAEQLYTYLSTEVLEQQPPAIQHFLLRAAVLTHLTIPVCRAVLEVDDAAALLRGIQEQQLFLTATGGPEEPSYRLHQLFREFLVNQLRTTDPAEFTRLHRRAAAYFEQQDDPGQAMEHLFAAAGWDQAAALATRIGRAEIDSGRGERVERWLRHFPDRERASQPALLLLDAWLLAAQSHFARATEILARAEHLLQAADDRAGYAEALGLRARLATARKDGPQMITYAQAVLATPEAAPSTRAHALRLSGIGYAAAGEAAQADRAFAAAWDAYAALGDALGCAWVTADWGAALIVREDLARAVEQLEKALAYARQSNNSRLLALLLFNLAVVHQFRGHLQQADEELTAALGIVRRLRWRRIEAEILMNQAENTLELSGPAAALRGYEETEVLAQQAAPAARVGARAGQARCLRYLGRAQDAMRLAREGLATALAGEMAFGAALCRLEWGAACLADAPDEALALLQQAEETFTDLHRQREIARAAVVRAVALFATADYAGALAALERAYHAAAASGNGLYLALELATTHGLPLLRRACRDNDRYSAWLAAAHQYLAAEQRPTETPPPAEPRSLHLVRERPPLLEVYSLGQATVYRDGVAVARSAWQTATAKELFFYFVEWPEGQRREVVLAALWPNYTATQASTNFHTALRRLHSALGPAVITAVGNLYLLNPSLALWHDGGEALRLIQQARQRGADAAARPRWRAAADLLQGPFAEEFYRDWAGARRQFWEAQTREALVWLADEALARHALDEALAWAQRLLALDPLAEAAHTFLMRIYATMGNMTLLMQQYNELCRVLEYELGGPPSAETRALYQQLLKTPPSRLQRPS